MYSKNRVVVFIDGNNFYFALKRNNRSTRVDYYQLANALTGPERTLIRAYYYNSAFDPVQFPEKYKEQRPFLDSLEHTPYLELRLGKLTPNRDGHPVERGVSVRLASEMVYYAAKNFFDTAILVSEDAEFAPALKLVKELGKQVEVTAFNDTHSRELLRAADRVIQLEEIFDQPQNPVEEKQPENITNESGILDSFLRKKIGLRR